MPEGPDTTGNDAEGAPHHRDLGRKMERLKAAVASEFDQMLQSSVAGGLYLVATPIGNLGDVTLRSLCVLFSADYVYCEDTRVSQVLLSRFGLSRRLRNYHDHSSERVRDDILALLSAGRSIALISDAGTPGISDPGFKLVRAAATAGHKVLSIPGPSALLAAAVTSGLPVDRFLFAGFLPQKSGQRTTQLRELSEVPATLIFYESPHRIAATLRDMAAVFGTRAGVIARELTKRYEEIVRGSLIELADWSEQAAVRGEVVLVIGPPLDEPGNVSDEVIATHLKEALQSASPSQASKLVAEALGVSKSRVYDIGIKAKRGNA